MLRLETSTLLKMIEQAVQLEEKRDLENELEVLKPIWSDLFALPEIQGLNSIHQAEIYRLCGHLAIQYARAKAFSGGKKNGKNLLQEHGKDLLCKSLLLYERQGELCKISLVKCHLAMSCYYEGFAEDADIYLTDATFACGDCDCLSYLRVQCTRLIMLGHLNNVDEALKVLRRIERPVMNCDDLILQTMYWINCGYVYDISGDPMTATAAYGIAKELAERANNLRLFAQASNGLAYTLQNLGRFNEAITEINKAIKVSTSLKDFGYLASFFETKASIERRTGNLDKALDTINESLEVLKTTNDLTSHKESIWTKIEIFFALSDTINALIAFTELKAVCEQISEKEVTDAAKEFDAKMRGYYNPEIGLSIDEPQIEIFDTSVRMHGLHIEHFELFRIPASKARFLGFDNDVIVATSAVIANPQIFRVVENNNYGVANIKNEVISFNDEYIQLYLLNDGSDFPQHLDKSEFYSCGQIQAVAMAKTLEENYLLFENFNGNCQI